MTHFLIDWKLRGFLLAIVTAVHLTSAETANWPRWRGPANAGSTSDGTYPTKWDANHVLWKTPLPGKGSSTPIIWNRRIYLTSPADGQDAALAFDWSGQQLWRTTLGAEAAGRHRNGSGSNPSPVTDGDGIFVNFKSGNLAALNLDGTVRWKTNLVERFGPLKLGWDHGASPVLTERDVIIAQLHGGDSWIAAFDKKTGEMRWKTDRNYDCPRENNNGYATPLVIRHGGKEAILSWASDRLTAHEATDGKLLWVCGDFNPEGTPNWPAIATPVIAGDLAIVAFGRVDRGGLRLHGIKLGGKGDVTKTHRMWKREDVGAFVPSPSEYRGRIYILTDRGQVDCIDPKTGKTVWSESLPRGSSNFYSSPVIASGNMYAVREDGMVFVARVEGGFELLAENKFTEPVIACVVPVADRLLVRSAANLYCIVADAQTQ